MPLTSLGTALDSASEICHEIGVGIEIEPVLVAGFHLKNRLVFAASPLPVMSTRINAMHVPSRLHHEKCSRAFQKDQSSRGDGDGCDPILGFNGSGIGEEAN